jgi:putative DNA primase/helicase
MQGDPIPAELRVRGRWVLYRIEEREGKPTKVPYQPGSPKARASSTDLSTWGSYDKAVNAADGADGKGYVVADDEREELGPRPTLEAIEVKA